MPTVSGRVVFDVNRSNSITGVDTGLQNVPVVLQNVASGVRLTVLTDANGDFSFINVPSGDYILVEAFGEVGGVATPADFNLAAVGPVPTGNDPPISFATNPPVGANNIDSLTPNTINLTVNVANVNNQNFLDGPVIYTSLNLGVDPCISISPTNLITVGDNGTFGSFPAGTAANTSPPVEPYPGMTVGFTYSTNLTPADGQYVIKNIMTSGGLFTANVWWRITNKTTRDETGRLMAAGGSNPGAILFTDTVNVTTDTNYIFSGWVLNLIKRAGFADPAFRVEILDQGGGILYNESLSGQLPFNPNAPEWKEVGTVINSLNNTQLTINFISEGPAAAGNDFAIEDIEFREIQLSSTLDKSIDISFADIGDVITYTVVARNTCSNPFTNVVFTDIVPDGLTFQNGSVLINGVPFPALDPNLGFSLPDIPGGGSVTVEFSATATSIPAINPTINNANLSYLFSSVPGGTPVSYSLVSNDVPLFINTSDLVVNKSVDILFADISDVITYTIDITNIGDVIANFVKVSDIIPNGTSFLAGSINTSVIYTTNIPELTLDLLNPIVPNETVIISFSVVVDTIPIPNPIPNSTTVDYRYTVDPAFPNGISATHFSNTVFTQVNTADLDISKSVDKEIVTKGGVLTYTIVVANNGNIVSNPVIVTDLVPVDTTYINNTLTVDGVPNGSNPSLGVDISPVNQGISKTIVFDVLVDPNILNFPISNIAQVDYEYRVDPSGPITQVTRFSNEVLVEIADLNVIKIVDKAYAEVLETLVYTTVLTNTGSSDLLNLTFIDAPPVGTSFIVNSVYIDNVNAPGESPIVGINLGDMLQGQIIEVEYSVTIDSLPAPPELRNISGGSFSYYENFPTDLITLNYASNEVITNIILSDFQVSKTVDRSFALIGDTLIYTIVGTNNSNVAIFNLVFTDTISPYTSFVGGSVVIDGISRPSEDPTVGILLGGLGISESVVIEFSVIIDSVPLNREVINSGIFDFNYIVDPSEPPVIGSAITNDAITYIETLEIDIFKSVDKINAKLGEEITYNFIILNNGTLDIYNTIFTDIIPSGTEFVDGSVVINGIVNPIANPEIGFTIGDLNAGEITTISFKVLVTEIVCDFEFTNDGTLTFNYDVGNQIGLNDSVTSNSVTTGLSNCWFKQMFIDNIFNTGEGNPDIYEIVNLNLSIIIDSYEFINTATGISLEGQNLTGKKLMVHGRVIVDLEYLTNPPDMTSYFETFESNFCNFIVIEEEFNEDCCIEIVSQIEDIFYSILDERNIFTNVTLTLTVQSDNN